MFKMRRLRKQLEKDSFDARLEMEAAARKELNARLKAVEIRFLNETRQRGQSSM